MPPSPPNMSIELSDRNAYNFFMALFPTSAEDYMITFSWDDFVDAMKTAGCAVEVSTDGSKFKFDVETKHYNIPGLGKSTLGKFIRIARPQGNDDKMCQETLRDVRKRAAKTFSWKRQTFALKINKDKGT